MTISTETSRMSYVGNDVATEFAYTFKIFAAADLTVTQRDATTDVETTLTLDTHYTVSGVGDAAGGIVTMVTAPPTGDTLTIRRVMDMTQASVWPTGGAYRGPAIENALDKALMIDLQQQDQLDRTFHLPETADPADYDLELPIPETGQVLIWGTTGLTAATLADSDNVALPGDNRTVPSLTAYLANNAIFNPRDYGAVGDGTTDDAAAFQACETARAAVNGRLFASAPAVGYRFDSTVVASAARGIDWEMAPGTEIICHVANGPAVKFAHVSATRHLRIDGLRIKAGVAGHRQPLVQFGASGSSVSRFSVKNLVLDFNFLNRDGIHQFEMFDGTFHFTIENGENGGPAIVSAAPTLNSGNVHYDAGQSTTSPILFLLNEFPQGNSLNSIHINACKIARRSDLTTNKFFAGTVAAGGAALAATTIDLTAGQGTNYAVGDWIAVASGSSNMWVDKVASVATDTIGLTAVGGLPFALLASDPVIVGNWFAVAGPNIKSLKLSVPQFERANGVLGFNSTTVDIDHPVIGADHFRTAYLARGCQGWTIRKPEAVVAYGAGAVVLHQGNDVNNSRNNVIGPIKVTGTMPTVLRADGGSAIAFTNRTGGAETLLGIWTQTTTVAANQSAVQLVGPNGDAVNVLGFRMRSKGALIALQVEVRAARTAGTLTATVYKNGSATTLTAVLDGTNAIYKLTELFDGSTFVTFNAGDMIDVRVTTDASWAPTTNDLQVHVYACL